MRDALSPLGRDFNRECHSAAGGKTGVNIGWVSGARLLLPAGGNLVATRLLEVLKSSVGIVRKEAAEGGGEGVIRVGSRV